MDVQRTNRLAGETSPYLQQHADNPVDWYPWGDEALEKARREDKPILLSIGYSACHWCHVMAHESFEDPETAAVMNDLMVNIKVDREERPDLDKIYQTAHQLLAQRGGGWPLTMFLTPDQVPFFGGTYFPREPRYGMPAFKDLLHQVERFYREHRDDVTAQNVSLLQALDAVNGAPAPAGEVRLNAAPLDGARRQLAQSFDADEGGFGAEPKFPHPTHLERLLRHWAATDAAGHADEQALHMATFTLRKMAQGGIYDQLGGGFYRYAVDGHWMIPHFEKMLYDNGPLLALYAEAWSATGDPLFKRVAAETGQWVMREMQSPRGGYYSTLDADSEGVEGKFYVWDKAEVSTALDERENCVAGRYFGLNKPPNFEGHWHLRVAREPGEVATACGLTAGEAEAVLDQARRKLFAVRERRVRPGRDEKVLTAWNGLTIKGMAVAGLRLGRPELIQSAERALDFIRTELWRQGRLLATYKDERARLVGYLDDYVFLIDGILALLQARWRTDDLLMARALGEAVLEHFEDGEAGGFFFTADDAEHLIQRPKTFADEALPSGNGVAAFVLLRLGYLLGEGRFLTAAERTLRAAWPMIEQAPYAHDALLQALEEFLYPPEIVVIRGEETAIQQWQRICIDAFAPRRWVLAIPADEPDLPVALAARKPAEGVTAYICQGTTCSPPIMALEEFRQRMAAATD